MLKSYACFCVWLELTHLNVYYVYRPCAPAPKAIAILIKKIKYIFLFYFWGAK